MEQSQLIAHCGTHDEYAVSSDGMAPTIAGPRIPMQRLLSGSRFLLALAALGLVTYGAVRLLARHWPSLALFVALAYLIMMAVFFAAFLLYLWFGLPAELNVHTPLCDEKDESSPHPDRERGSTGNSQAAVR